MTTSLSKIFAALADPTRRDMVARLTAPMPGERAGRAVYDVSLQAVSKHLKVLEDAGLVTRRRDAQRRPAHLEVEVFDLVRPSGSSDIDARPKSGIAVSTPCSPTSTATRHTTTHCTTNEHKELHHESDHPSRHLHRR
ncbi:MAG: metalloregulator ArsR/SmtB family transcription factor [Acidimicrobiales bacterium]